MSLWDKLLKSDDEVSFIFENDVVFANDFDERFETAFASLPNDWDILYLGGQVIGDAVVAILTWLFGQKGSDESTGGAIPVANLYLAADGRVRLEMGTDGGLDAIPPDATECGESEPVLRGRKEAASLCFVVFKKQSASLAPCTKTS